MVCCCFHAVWHTHGTLEFRPCRRHTDHVHDALRILDAIDCLVARLLDSTKQLRVVALSREPELGDRLCLACQRRPAPVGTSYCVVCALIQQGQIPPLPREKRQPRYRERECRCGERYRPTSPSQRRCPACAAGTASGAGGTHV